MRGPVFSLTWPQPRLFNCLPYVTVSKHRAALSKQTGDFARHSHTAQLICYLAGRERGSSQRPDITARHVCLSLGELVILQHADRDRLFLATSHVLCPRRYQQSFSCCRAAPEWDSPPRLSDHPRINPGSHPLKLRGTLTNRKRLVFWKGRV